MPTLDQVRLNLLRAEEKLSSPSPESTESTPTGSPALEVLYASEIRRINERPLTELIALQPMFEARLEEFPELGVSGVLKYSEQEPEADIRSKFRASALIYYEAEAMKRARAEELREFFVRYAVSAVLVLALIAVPLAFLVRGDGFQVPFGLIPMFGGLIGGAVHILNPVVVREAGSVSKLRQLALVGPISGMFFALVLFLLFAGGMVRGTLFPEIHTVSEADVALAVRQGIQEQVNGEKPKFNSGALRVEAGQIYPNSGADFAKVVVWSFLAGYAGRMVPDLLALFVRKSKEPKRASAG